MQAEAIDIPRILIAALRGGSGKTVVSIGIIAALARSGRIVAPFKKGPDYIDAGWLAAAAGQPCHNLDPFLFADENVCKSFYSHARPADIAVIEGNRGLYDGLDIEGSTSTASLAKLINSPVVLCVDCTKSTRTMAAVILGCLHFDLTVNIAGVILNRVAGRRHQSILRRCIEEYCGIPVIGAIPKLDSTDFPERHMGLIPTPEHEGADGSIEAARKIAENHIDIKAVSDIAHGASGNELPYIDMGISAGAPETVGTASSVHTASSGRPRIGILRDSAFQFYYPENIDALTATGAEVIFMSPLAQDSPPDIDALYIGGGFPETHAGPLSENVVFRDAIKAAADAGMPIYAECGGLMYLGQSLVLDKTYPMTGVLPIVFGFFEKPQGHGYTIITVARENPYYPVGTELKGHEFHYSRVLQWHGDDPSLAFSMKKGRGLVNRKDGMVYKNVLATYTHIHALGVPGWAEALVGAARKWSSGR